MVGLLYPPWELFSILVDIKPKRIKCIRVGLLYPPLEIIFYFGLYKTQEDKDYYFYSGSKGSIGLRLNGQRGCRPYIDEVGRVA